MRSLQITLNSDAFKELVADPSFQRAAMSGVPHSIGDLRRYRELVGEPGFKEVAKDMGYSDVEGELHPFVALTARTFRKLEILRRDPEIEALLQDRQFIEQVRSQNTWRLLNDPRVLTLAKRISAIEVPPPDPIDETQSHSITQEVTPPSPSSRTFYKWRDKEGNLNITTTPPPKGAELVE